jgi:hypothetical protein
MREADTYVAVKFDPYDGSHGEMSADICKQKQRLSQSGCFCLSRAQFCECSMLMILHSLNQRPNYSSNILGIDIRKDTQACYS